MSARTERILISGMYAGLIGYAVVVVVLAGLNLIAGRSPFYTAALFGSTLFYGLDDPAALTIAAGPVLAYNGLHVLIFLGLGLVASWLVTKAEEYPILRYVVLFTLVFIAAHAYGALLLFAQPLLAGDAWWQVGIATLGAAVAMGAYLLWAHPILRWSLKDIPMGSEAG